MRMRMRCGPMCLLGCQRPGSASRLRSRDGRVGVGSLSWRGGMRWLDDAASRDRGCHFAAVLLFYSLTFFSLLVSWARNDGDAATGVADAGARTLPGWVRQVWYWSDDHRAHDALGRGRGGDGDFDWQRWCPYHGRQASLTPQRERPVRRAGNRGARRKRRQLAALWYSQSHPGASLLAAGAVGKPKRMQN